MHCFQTWRGRLQLAVTVPGLTACLLGCSTPSVLDQHFGQATQETRWLQTADPMAPLMQWHLPRTDGETAHRTVQRYYRSLDNPGAPAGVLGRETPKGASVAPPGAH